MMKTLSAATITAFLLLAPMGAGAQSPGGASNSSETYRQLNLFGDVFERVRSEYVESISDEQLVEAAINGMLSSLDPHSSYLNKKNFQDMQVQTRGEFGGLGIEVTMESGLVKVVSPIDDTPAFRAGLKPGDLITQIDDTPVQGLTLSDAVQKMLGPAGTNVRITVRRGDAGEPFEVTMTRALIKIQSVRYRTEGNVGYIRITTFNEQTQTGLEKAVASIQKDLGDKLSGYVLDLRNNPGGLLDQAVAVCDEFLEQGEIVSTRGRRPEDSQRFDAKHGDHTHGSPMVVLINGGSASASEIVAGALQDHHRAIVMGTQSFGKGSVQTIIPLPGHGAIRLTTARYYTPSGRSIQNIGIKPDIEVQEARLEETPQQGPRRREADLPGALKNDTVAPPAVNATTPPPAANPGPGAAVTPGTSAPAVAPPSGTPGAPAAPGGKPAAENPEGTPASDYQLSRALDLLRGVALFNQRAVN